MNKKRLVCVLLVSDNKQFHLCRRPLDIFQAIVLLSRVECEFLCIYGKSKIQECMRHTKVST